jgi:acetylornithine/N-succinyldiaminopimelate aminotransferase
MNTYARADVTFNKGIGSKLYDDNGNEYLDFVAGIAVNCLGHSSPVIVKAIKEQSEKLIHISNLYWNQNQLDLAKKLADNSDLDKTFFCNSGTEAVEVAIKLGRKKGKQKSPSKNEIIFMKNSFHGRTLGALAVTGQEKYQKDYYPLMGGVNSVNFNDISDLKSKVNENTCAIILELIQGEGGIIKIEEEFLKVARKLCDEFDAVLIFDEVQCGIGRMGTLFAYQSFGVIPDIVCLAKGLGGGFPIGATIAKKDIADIFVPGDHGCTFGGSPLATAVSLAVINELIDNNIIDGVSEKGEYLKNKLEVLKDKYEIVTDVLGMGLLLGIKVSVPPKEIVEKCFKNKLLLVGAGKDVIRIVPALNVSKEEIDTFIGILDKVLSEEGGGI